jgi:hypothetical protein
MSEAESRLLFRAVIGMSREFIKKYGNVPFVCNDTRGLRQTEYIKEWKEKRRRHGQANLLAGL